MSTSLKKEARMFTGNDSIPIGKTCFVPRERLNTDQLVMCIIKGVLDGHQGIELTPFLRRNQRRFETIRHRGLLIMFYTMRMGRDQCGSGGLFRVKAAILLTALVDA